MAFCGELEDLQDSYKEKKDTVLDKLAGDREAFAPAYIAAKEKMVGDLTKRNRFHDALAAEQEILRFEIQRVVTRPDVVERPAELRRLQGQLFNRYRSTQFKHRTELLTLAQEHEKNLTGLSKQATVRDKLELGKQAKDALIEFQGDPFISDVRTWSNKTAAVYAELPTNRVPSALSPESDAFQAFRKQVDVVSKGHFAGSQSSIRCPGHPQLVGTRGLAVLAFHHNELLINRTFDTYGYKTESAALAKAIGELPQGAFVVCAVKDEGSRSFTEAAQQALLSIGAEKGLMGSTYRDSYLLVGAKGFKGGQAEEKAGRRPLEL